MVRKGEKMAKKSHDGNGGEIEVYFFEGELPDIEYLPEKPVKIKRTVTVTEPDPYFEARLVLLTREWLERDGRDLAKKRLKRLYLDRNQRRLILSEAADPNAVAEWRNLLLKLRQRAAEKRRRD
jgi:hypothetical protein